MPAFKKIVCFLETAALAFFISLLVYDIFIKNCFLPADSKPVYKITQHSLEFPVRIIHKQPSSKYLSLVSFDASNWAKRIGYNSWRFQECLDAISIFKAKLPLEIVNKFILSRHINWWAPAKKTVVFIEYKSRAGRDILLPVNNILKNRGQMSLEKIMFLGLGLFEYAAESSMAVGKRAVKNPCAFLDKYLSLEPAGKFSRQAVEGMLKARQIKIIIKSNE